VLTRSHKNADLPPGRSDEFGQNATDGTSVIAVWVSSQLSLNRNALQSTKAPSLTVQCLVVAKVPSAPVLDVESLATSIDEGRFNDFHRQWHLTVNTQSAIALRTGAQMPVHALGTWELTDVTSGMVAHALDKRQLDDPHLKQIAARYQRTPAQILIRWNLQLARSRCRKRIGSST
jgi:hypothetical protein